jgi:alkaline phosphatase
MRSINTHFTAILFLIFSLLLSIPQEKKSDQHAIPKNVILLIGDGMSYSQITATEYSHGSLNMTSMPYQGVISTHSLNRRVTDSAAAATAIATGHKTNNGMLAVLPNGASVQTIAQFAKEIGKSTAMLASSHITHATPAAFAVHHDRRGEYYNIAEKLVNSGINMILGAGSDYFLPAKDGGKRKDGKNLITEMMEKGYVYINSDDEIEQISEHEYVIAFLEPLNLKPYPERADQMLRLTNSALARLSQNPEGFFFMIEGSQIDWAGHKNNAEWMIREMIDFDKVIGAVLEFAEKDGNTLVVVTSDHETGGLTLLAGSLGNSDKFSYKFSNRKHSAQKVPVFSFGPSAELFKGSFDNTDIARKLLSLWGKEIEEPGNIGMKYPQ